MNLNDETPVAAGAADQDRVLSQPEAARLMGLSTRTLERLVEIGEAPPRILLTGRRVAYWRTDVLVWLRARTTRSAA